MLLFEIQIIGISRMFNYGRGWQSYMLLLAIMFKSLIMGALFTLAIHNVCLENLISDDFNWKRLNVEKRKRNDEHSLLSILYAGEATECDHARLKRTSLLYRKLLTLFSASTNRHTNGNTPFNLNIRYIPERIFLQLCTLRR